MRKGAWVVVVAAITGATAVAAAAVGAHLDQVMRHADAQRAWESANLIHLIHAPTLLAIGLCGRFTENRVWATAAALLAVGVLVFSGSLYRVAFFESVTGAPLAPLGGVMIMLGWLMLAFAAVRNRS